MKTNLPDGALVSFLAGDAEARKSFPRAAQPLIHALAQKLSTQDLKDRGLVEDVIGRTWELLLRRPAGAFKPKLGSASTYLAGIVRRAVRDIRSQYRWSVSSARDYGQTAEPETMTIPPRFAQVDPPDNKVILELDLTIALAESPALAEAARLIALEDCSLTAAAEAVGMTRFSLSRRLRLALDESYLAA